MVVHLCADPVGIWDMTVRPAGLAVVLLSAQVATRDGVEVVTRLDCPPLRRVNPVLA